MAAKKKIRSPELEEGHLCYICGKEIHGDHVYIKTRRRSELHIHFECMPGKQQVN
ncbi:hypothetical protein [Lacrimispora sp. 38-1]|uniref:hypothetical protein n=1 Tax=Lacrimispora sp. 38-1 TaxID=3125778 RepID=UPI003CFAD9B1